MNSLYIKRQLDQIIGALLQMQQDMHDHLLEWSQIAQAGTVPEAELSGWVCSGAGTFLRHLNALDALDAGIWERIDDMAALQGISGHDIRSLAVDLRAMADHLAKAAPTTYQGVLETCAMIRADPVPSIWSRP
jgi:hypothetical protein